MSEDVAFTKCLPFVLFVLKYILKVDEWQHHVTSVGGASDAGRLMLL